MLIVFIGSLPLIIPCFFSLLFLLPLGIFIVSLLFTWEKKELTFPFFLIVYCFFAISFVACWFKMLINLNWLSLGYVNSILITAAFYTGYVFVINSIIKNASNKNLFLISFVNMINFVIVIMYLVILGTLTQTFNIHITTFIFLVSLLPLVFCIAEFNNLVLKIYKTGYNTFKVLLSGLWFFIICFLEAAILVDTEGRIEEFIPIFIIESFLWMLGLFMAGYILVKTYRFWRKRVHSIKEVSRKYG